MRHLWDAVLDPAYLVDKSTEKNFIFRIFIILGS